jgi:RNA polymerase sigma-32 factor
LFFNLRRLRARIEDASGTRLGDEGRKSIAKQLRVKIAEVESMETRLGAHDQSLNAPLTESSEDDWQDFLPDQRPSPEDVAIGMRDGETRSRWLAEALGELSPREQTIIRQRRLTDEGATLERVRQLESRALNKLRDSISRRVERPRDLLLEN